MFIGPKAENTELLRSHINRLLEHHAEWRQSYHPDDKPLGSSLTDGFKAKLESAFNELLSRHDKNLPYFHPRYNAQMLKDPPITAILGYLAFMMSNPNNHAYEGGPVTTDMEMEVTRTLLDLCGYKDGWGHLASGGSLANLEALWAVREKYKGGGVYFSEVSHYSWKRICNILGIQYFTEVPVDENFRIDLDLLEKDLKKKKTLMVIGNIGSTGTGSVDDLEGLLLLKDRYGFHLHLDAAYGGFARSCILDKHYEVMPQGSTGIKSVHLYRQLELIAESDSITIDPHKHGLLPYGAGAVLYKDQNLRDMILNTAPYTYHQLDKPNIGMFSLEGSRPGAMAAACWLTYKVMPPNSKGVGVIVQKCLDQADYFYRSIEKSDYLANFNKPDLDINTFYFRDDEYMRAHVISKKTLEIYHEFSVENPDAPFILSKFVTPPHIAKRAHRGLRFDDKENFTAMRAVFMKPWGEMKNYYYLRMLLDSLNEFCAKL
ncbi:MAG: aminotransferase class I/II-fold pyridoxal phosphate-dependent enzyme [Ignavibacteriaceae bacterium]|nr:aminotransferase class I/II-fold pyridoxal phosphate-dependent enzyme [Ignavibacteriaceae bacterium]